MVLSQASLVPWSIEHKLASPGKLHLCICFGYFVSSRATLNRLYQLLALTAHPSSADVALGKETQGILLAFLRIYLVSGVRDAVCFHFFFQQGPNFQFHSVVQIKSEALPCGIASSFIKRET